MSLSFKLIKENCYKEEKKAFKWLAYLIQTNIS